MGNFSIGEAYGAGFSLVARKPLHVLTWGIVYSVLRMLPFVLMMFMVGPDIIKGYADFFANAAAGGDPQAGMQEFSRTVSRMQSFQALGWLTSILAMAILNAAVFRAVIRPQDGGFLGLKLGMDEVWQGLVYLCAAFLLAIFAVLIVLAACALGAIVFFMGRAVGSGVGDWISGIGVAAAVIGGIGAILWICIRFSLAGPATFAQRNFQLFESWTLTKGHSWSLLGLMLLLMLTILGFEIVFGGILITIFFSLGSASAFSPESIEAFFAQPTDVWMMQAMPWLVGLTLVSALLSGAVYTILLAPFASAYRQIVGEPQSV
jgi:hypothetical protein